MKNILMIIAVLLFGAATAFSQTYYVTVSWDDDECGCLDQGESYYAVKVIIYDDANDMVVVEGTDVRVDFGTLTVDVSVPEVNTHCSDPNLPNTPSFEVTAGAGVYCDNSNPPELCTTGGYTNPTNSTCTQFANNNVSVTLPAFN